MKNHLKTSEAFVLLSHSALALLAGLAFEAVHSLPVYFRLTLGIAYIVISIIIFGVLRRREIDDVDAKARAELETLRREMNAEILRLGSEKDEWLRYHLLSNHMLSIVSEFLKDRYKLNHRI